MRKLLLTTAAMLALAAPAKADGLILAAPTVAQSFVDLGGLGFGAVHRLLDLHQNGSESGFITVGTGGIAVVNQDAIGGADKGSAPTLGALGWTQTSQFVLGVNVSQQGNTALTLQDLNVRLWGTSPTFNLIDTFSLVAPITFSATDDNLQNGNGQGIFQFTFDDAARLRLAADLLFSGSSGFFLTVGATLGCPAGSPASCAPSNDGQDSILAAAVAVPGPVMAGGLPGVLAACVGLWGLALKRRRRNGEHLPA